MSTTFYCIGDADTVLGFRLAGVPGQVVTTPAQAGEALARAIAQPEIGIVILAASTAAHIRETVDECQSTRDRPLLVELPGPEGGWSRGSHLLQMIHSAIGISLEEEERS